MKRRHIISLGLIIALLGACTEAKPPLSGEALDKMKVAASPVVSESSDAQAPPLSEEALSEGSGTRVTDHPQVEETEKLQREVYIPENVQGKWKAVKILVKTKADESKNEVKTIALGSQFDLDKGALKVTVGPLLPNFVMSKTAYTSMNNELINPAVQLEVEENGKIIYKGWAFQKHPAMYAFEHEAFALELLEAIPADVS